MVVEVFFEILFSGRIVFLLILSGACGYFLGVTRLGTFGNISWVIGLLIVQLGWFVTAPVVGALIDIGATGAAGFSVEAALLLGMLPPPVVLFVALMFGRYAANSADQALNDEAKKLSAAKALQELNILVGHPELTVAGFFKARWLTMDDAERLHWVTGHIVMLRRTWREGLGGGFAAHGTDLPMKLARIDQRKLSDGKRDEPPLSASRSSRRRNQRFKCG